MRISQKQSSLISRAMFRTLIDAPPTIPTRDTSTSLTAILFNGDTSTAPLRGRFAEQSPFTSHKPNGPILVKNKATFFCFTFEKVRSRFVVATLEAWTGNPTPVLHEREVSADHSVHLFPNHVQKLCLNKRDLQTFFHAGKFIKPSDEKAKLRQNLFQAHRMVFVQANQLTDDKREKLEHAASVTHHLMTMMTRSQWDGSVDSRKSAQSSGSETRVILVNMEFAGAIQVEKRIFFLDCDIQRPKPLRG